MAYFREEQNLSDLKLWFILMALSAAISGGIFFALYMQLKLQQPVADKLTDTQLIIGGVSILLITALVDWLILSSKIEVEVRSGDLRYRFKPFIMTWQIVKSKQIQDYHIKEITSIRETGGLGYRIRPGGVKALSAKGNMYMELSYNKGKKLLLGTQKPAELQRVMEKLMKKERDHG